MLLSNGAVVPDSTAILNWLEHYKPEPALMPMADKDRARIDVAVCGMGVIGGYIAKPSPNAFMMVLRLFCTSISFTACEGFAR